MSEKKKELKYDKDFILYSITTNDYLRTGICQELIKDKKFVETKVIDHFFDDDVLVINTIGIDENQEESIIQIVFA